MFLVASPIDSQCNEIKEKNIVDLFVALVRLTIANTFKYFKSSIFDDLYTKLIENSEFGK